MQLSKRTIDILKNFSEINTNIMFRQGNELSIISAGRDILARATIEETFPRDFAIYDLPQLLRTFSILDNCEIEFGDQNLVVESGGNEIQYFYTNEENIQSAPQKSVEIDELFTFQLGDKELVTLMKSADVLAAPNISFVGNGKTAKVVVSDIKPRGSNNYKHNIGKTDKLFNFKLTLDNMRMIVDSYTITLSPRKFIYMVGSKYGVRYWLAVDPSSTAE